MKVIAIVCWYNEQNAQRRAELIQCIKNTAEQVDRIIIVCENSFLPHELSGLNLYECCIADERPHFDTFFAIANNIAEKDDIVIICNTDIYPEPGYRKHLEGIGNNECYALARWDVQADGSKILLDRWDTADTWVFKAPIREIKGSDFYMGKAGCDNAINERIHQAGYNITNPSKTIQFNHLHLSGVINYNSDHKVPKPYLLITPHELGAPAIHHFN